MFPTRAPTPALLELADAQSGLLSCSQVVELGGSEALIRRCVRDGHWHRLTAGILSTTRSPSWLGWVWAGVLVAGPSAVVGGAAAAHLHRIGPEPRIIDIWAPDNSPRWRSPWRFHRAWRAGRGEPARVSLEQATIDVCSAGSPDDVAATLASALGTRRTSPGALRSLALESPTLRHRGLVLSMLEDVGSGAESPLEVRYMRDVERAHGLPTAQRQVRVSSGTRTDVGYLDHLVLVELDGRLGHDGTGAWRDWARDNNHAMSHFTTLRYGWHDVVRRPCDVAWQVGEALAQGGWAGMPRRCRSCRTVPRP